MIQNWNYHNLHMDFSSMFEGGDHPSDIDMFYLCEDGTLIIGEIKSNRGHFSQTQKILIKKILDMHDGDGIGLYITHDKLVQNGDESVDVSVCPIEEIYIKGEKWWRKPKIPLCTKDVLDYYKARSKAKYIDA